ncbi:YbaB/EbfC family nucleoid-associated protein [Dactylosporangium sp. CA-152071]|uniref:YbaB/EbfC family nucleoid-associated protein n=1 Tax=Dactylosporangium sp. CA-152071 TaxID=3239933 RepID=UPI003D91E9C4
MTDDYARRIDEAQRQLAELRATAGKGPGPQPGEAEGAGRAGDGAVDAVADRGRLLSVTLAPQVMRLTDEELGELLTDAVNQALRRSRARLLGAAGDDAPPPLATLETSVEQVRDQGERAMYEIQAALNRAIGRVGDRTGLGGDTGGQGLEQLLASLTSTLRAAQHKTSDQDQEPDHTGADDEGHVSARVDAGGTVTGFAFGPRAMRLPSIDLAAHAVTAVNAALATAGTAAAERSAADLADLRRRVGELREASVTQMTQLTASLTGIMSRIREP